MDKDHALCKSTPSSRTQRRKPPVARYVDAIDLPIPIQDAFDYLADFSHTAEWDPGVADARRLTGGKVGLGSRFEVGVSFLGRRIPFVYEITAFERPSRLVLSGSEGSLRSIDEITFVSRSGGTRVTYEARLELAGIRQLADPLLDLWFQRIGRLAVRGLRERMATTGSRAPARARRAATAQRSERLERERTKGVRKVRAGHKQEGVAR
jgi:carbon monoxide dehydrogenase subunit G